MAAEKHMIPVVVMVAAEGADRRDAINVACATVEQALTNAGHEGDADALVLSVSRSDGTAYSSRLIAIQELNRAFRDGLVRFAVDS